MDKVVVSMQQMSFVAGKPESDPDIVDDIEPLSADTILLKDGLMGVGWRVRDKDLAFSRVLEIFGERCLSILEPRVLGYSAVQIGEHCGIDSGLTPKEYWPVIAQRELQIAGCLGEGMRIRDVIHLLVW
jgi:hypothetical protein